MTLPVAIIGGGFSGTLLAVNLLESPGPDLLLFESRGVAGTGLAYGTRHPAHLLNVRARNMSAFADKPDHFVAWLARQPDAPRNGFVPRALFGRYVKAVFAEAQAASPGRLRIIPQAVTGFSDAEGGYRLHVAGGGEHLCSRVVLATGNPSPALPAGLGRQTLPEGLPKELIAPDPWTDTALEGIAPDDSVVLVGTGLTAVDVALMLLADGHQGRIVAVSRRGLLPRAHDSSPPPPPLDGVPVGLAALVKRVRQQGEALGWRQAVDQLRPWTQHIWQHMATTDRRRFLRHLRPYWDVHRHRMAPTVAAILAGMTAQGRFEALAGRIRTVTPGDGAATVTIALRGGGTRTEPAHRIINCTGPGIELATTTSPLLASLRDAGLAVADALGLGLKVDQLGRLLGRDGAAHPDLFAIGPLTRGEFWEI
ncbi:FAD/NAD(P)-binding protein, partial [Polymorphobacter sp.]|uniref:FAD/NAD(P)-binding protein n=1 Tax=Polymorphobacter sp. TaxID=1909290 RepID=UPI003F6F4637